MRDASVTAAVSWHSLLWLNIANAIGVLLSLELVVPAVGRALGDLSYGRWMPVHMNQELYGWCALPLTAYLLHIYRADRGNLRRWTFAALWAWTAALAVACISWLNGHISGKLFLDWTGTSRIIFPLALIVLWLVLTAALLRDWSHHTPLAKLTRIAGLIFLALVPWLIYRAADPAIYPAVNPDTGGPTASSQLESVLIIVLVLLLLPHGIAPRHKNPNRAIFRAAWSVFALEILLSIALGGRDVSHHRPLQWIALGSLLVWLPIVPAYYRNYQWHPATRLWRRAMLAWWALLVPTGWALFLPGVLDHYKFTDGLVAHSLLAMAGFISAAVILVLTQLLADDAWVYTRASSFWMWNLSVLAYVALFLIIGWIEGNHPTWTIARGITREVAYWIRVVLGVLMLIASMEWLLANNALLRRINSPAEVTA